jgi:serine/threonine-protein kinase
VLTVGAIWAGADDTPPVNGGTTAAAAGRQVAMGLGASPVDCRVDYQLRRDTGTGFAAAVAVRNNGRQVVDGWRLEFAYPGDQKMTRGSGAVWRQAGRQVTVTPSAAADRLAPGAVARLSVTGRYRGANPLPVVFTVNGTACEAVVSGLSGGTAAGAAASGRTTATRSGKAGSGSSGKGKSGNSGKGKNKGKDDG